MKKTLIAAAVCFGCLIGGGAASQTAFRERERNSESPDAEFHMARMIYRTFRRAGSHGYLQPMWAVDYPYAEEHFFPALRRATNIQVSDNEVHLELSDDRIYQFPFMLMQQPGQGGWDPTPKEASRLREYCLRGGFLLVDDLHGEYDWAVFETSMRRVFPDRPLVEIPEDDTLMHIFYDLDERTAIPGDRHLYYGPGGRTMAQMQGPPHWRGIYDDHHNLMVAVNFNSDMGDGWEHADDPEYPVPFTALAYKLGINYVVYAMTH